MLTPPFGLNLFVTSGLTQKPLLTIAHGVLPFIAIMLVCLLLVTYIQQLSLILPNLLLH
jgi:C4-dicarboxylate transporter DctM subunit